MSRTSQVVTLVLLGSALGLISKYVYCHWHDGYVNGATPSHNSGYHGGYYPWYGGGGYGYPRGPAPASRSVAARGGFGATGVSAGG
jgi:hypothetical protein